MDNRPPIISSISAPRRRWRFRLPVVLVFIGALIAGFYGIEHWRGYRAWKKHERELRSRGVPLDFKALIPTAISDEQNFAATPFVQSWFIRGTSESNFWRDSYAQAAQRMGKPAEKRSRAVVDLHAWQRAFDYTASTGTKDEPGVHHERLESSESRRVAAQAILEAMQDSEAHLSELRAASARPGAVYPIKYQDDVWGILLPHLRYLKSACQRLQLRACAALAAGKATNAFEDVVLMLYLADSVEREPFLISFLVRGNCRELGIETIWEGLAQRAWNENQLKTLQARLLKYNGRQALKKALEGEHAGGLMTPGLVRKHGINYVLTLIDTPEKDLWPKWMSSSVGYMIPGGWVYQEKLNYSRFFWIQQRPLIGENGDMKACISPTAATVSTAEVRRALKVGLFRVLWEHKLFAGFLVPPVGSASFRAAKTQTSTDHAVLACALERYRLVKGSYPVALDALVPEFIERLPIDFLTGDSYQYRRTGDDQFILYSVGWNETDDGGVPGEQIYDKTHGDWVWSYRANVD